MSDEEHDAAPSGSLPRFVRGLDFSGTTAEGAPSGSTIRAAAARRADGWAPMLDYSNGGRVIGRQRFYSEYEAIKEAEGLIQCMKDYPVAFRNDHPGPNQFIDLAYAPEMASADTKITTKETTL